MLLRVPIFVSSGIYISHRISSPEVWCATTSSYSVYLWSWSTCASLGRLLEWLPAWLLAWSRLFWQVLFLAQTHYCKAWDKHKNQPPVLCWRHASCILPLDELCQTQCLHKVSWSAHHDTYSIVCGKDYSSTILSVAGLLFARILIVHADIALGDVLLFVNKSQDDRTHMVRMSLGKP